MKFVIKPKPKLKLGKLFKDKDLQLDNLNTEIKYTENLTDDVNIDLQANVDLNWQKQESYRERCNSFYFKITKKF